MFSEFNKPFIWTLTSFEELRTDFSGHEDHIRCYWRVWELAFGNLRKSVPGTGDGFDGPMDTGITGECQSGFVDATASGGFAYDECSLGRSLAADASYILPAAAWIRDLHPLELTRTGHCKKPPTHIGIGGFCEWLRFGYRLKSFILSHDLPKG